MGNAHFYDRIAAIFSLILLAGLAMSSFYLAEQASRQTVEIPKAPPTATDYFATGFSLTRLNKQGEAVFRLTAKKMSHVPLDDTSEFEEPVVLSLRPDRTKVKITAAKGSAMADADLVTLLGDVHFQRAADQQREELNVRGPKMLVNMADEIATSDQPVNMALGASTMSGTGFYFNNETRQVRLDANVRGLLPPAKP
jgi:lipopolysaccharide export system protein LptC